MAGRGWEEKELRELESLDAVPNDVTPSSKGESAPLTLTCRAGKGEVAVTLIVEMFLGRSAADIAAVSSIYKGTGKIHICNIAENRLKTSER